MPDAFAVIAEYKDAASTIQSVLTMGAIVLGGVWTYMLFVRQRLSFPRINLDMAAETVTLSDTGRMVRVSVFLKSAGSVVVRSACAQLRLRQVAPVHHSIRHVADAIGKGYDPVPAGKARIEWPMLVGREWNWSQKQFEIEPGEKDSLHADFFIDKDVSTIELYFFMRNSRKRRKGLGWTITRLSTLQEERPMKGESQPRIDSQWRPRTTVLNEEQQEEEEPQRPYIPRPPEPPAEEPEEPEETEQDGEANGRSTGRI